jgi:small subunit ribosomal protein S18
MEAKEKSYSIKLPKSTPELSLTNPSQIQTQDSCPESGKQTRSADAPIRLKEDPYKRPMHQCIFCRHKIKLDYKNVQLLSQFVSPHTGIVYSQKATGMCAFKQEELEKTVNMAKKLGLMPFFYKESMFLDDPKLFDPFVDNLKKAPSNYDKRKLTADDFINKSTNKTQV